MPFLCIVMHRIKWKLGELVTVDMNVSVFLIAGLETKPCDELATCPTSTGMGCSPPVPLQKIRLD